MLANLPPDRRGSDPYGLTRRYTVPAGESLVLDLRNLDRRRESETFNPYVGVSWKAVPDAGGEVVVESHMGEDAQGGLAGALDADGWTGVSLPGGEGGKSIESVSGAGDAVVVPLAALRFTAKDEPARVWLRLGKSPFGVPGGSA